VYSKGFSEFGACFEYRATDGGIDVLRVSANFDFGEFLPDGARFVRCDPFADRTNFIETTSFPHCP
jgi:hypothetical protein